MHLGDIFDLEFLHTSTCWKQIGFFFEAMINNILNIILRFMIFLELFRTEAERSLVNSFGPNRFNLQWNYRLYVTDSKNVSLSHNSELNFDNFITKNRAGRVIMIE